MYIVNERSACIVNAQYAREIFLADTSDSVLLSACLQGEDKPRTLERYKTHEEALRAMNELVYALTNGEETFCMPDSSYYFSERIIHDSRTKRKGGS